MRTSDHDDISVTQKIWLQLGRAGGARQLTVCFGRYLKMTPGWRIADCADFDRKCLKVGEGCEEETTHKGGYWLKSDIWVRFGVVCVWDGELGRGRCTFLRVFG